MTGQPFEFSVGDAMMYQRIGVALAENGFGSYENVFSGMPVSDRGYGTYLGVLYMIVGNSILIARLVKAVLGAWMCVLIYKLASRNFGDSVGRMSAIFCMLMPNLIYYSGLHLKEAEMVFLTVLFLERADALIRAHKYTILTVLPVLLIGGSLFFFRTVLGATAMFALFTALILSSRRVMTLNKKLVITGWIIVALTFFSGSTIVNEVEEVWENRLENQDTALEFYATRKGGNELAKYASKSIFAPLIFVIPFPTMVNTPNQENQQLLHGGNFVKNIMAFFTMFGLFIILKEKKWRDHLLILSFTLGYLIVIALSAFAHSERFHQPALPFLLILAAFGVSNISNKEKNYFKWYMMFIFIVLIVWSWFKLSGRGMV
ncbi:MAG: glycosyltransferase family 39 protein [Paludibacter sp.]|nr:glycosyltransferase family 39 protein [Paludibacter sp.]